jgi:signal transduction histidine kinase
MSQERVLRIVQLAEDRTSADLVRSAVKEEGIVADWISVSNRAELEAVLPSGGIDLILSDYQHSSFVGMEALSLVRARRPDVPFIFVSGTVGEERAVEALRHGATDYVLIDRLFRLGSVIRRALWDSAQRLQRKLVEEQLRTTYAQLQRLLAASPAIIYSALPPEGHVITFVSENVRSRLGHDPGDLTRRSDFWASHVHPDDLPAAQACRAQSDGTERVCRYRFLHADGTYRWIEDRPNVVAAASGTPGEIVGSWMDVTVLLHMADDKARLQEQFHQAQKMEAVGSLAGGVAHDFNNILMVILSYSDFLLAKLPQDSTLRFELQEIKKAGNRAAALAHQLLAFSRKHNVNPQPINPSTAVRNLSKMIDRLIGEHIGVDLDLTDDTGCILCDPSHFDQILINLIVNARDAMPNGGRVIIGTGLARYAEAPGAEDGDAFAIWVSDTGVGIPRENLSRIFEPFFTTKPPGRGTGLGLAMVYGAVKQNSGRVEVESRVAAGTTIRVIFPRIVDAVSVAAPLPAEPYPEAQGKVILLAEDTVSVRRATATLLANLGFEVIEAESGEQALEKFTKGSETIDLVVTDVVMPGMNGPALCQELRKLRPGVKVIFSTGYLAEVELLERDLGATELVVHKPYDGETIVRAIRSILGPAGPPVENLPR